jgi:hypothetical protein
LDSNTWDLATKNFEEGQRKSVSHFVTYATKLEAERQQKTQLEAKNAANVDQI